MCVSYLFGCNLHNTIMFINVVSNEYSTACKSLQKHYVNLTRLPVKTLLPSLFEGEVIDFDQKKIAEAKSLDTEKMSYILDLVINSLKADVAIRYNNFLKVMKESRDADANELVTHLGKIMY